MRKKGIIMSGKFPWFDDTLSFEERTELLLKELKIKEKISLLQASSPAVPRLGIPAYNWWNEALHGVARAGRATVFPQAIGFASSFDPALIRRVGRATALEGRAKHRAAKALGNGGLDYFNLTYWTPNINIFRDPRWGRGQETYGEDPYLTSVIGEAMVKGLQGDDKKYLLSAACAKHFWGHSGPESLRHGFNAVIGDYDSASTYLPAFEHLVKKAKVAGVMGAYNRTNGELCCGSVKYIDELLRKEWGFDGYFTSDCGAICDFHINHHAAGDAAESSAIAVRSGCDINCGNCYGEGLYQAYRRKLVSKEDIDSCVRRALMIRMRLGLFDRDGTVPGAETPASVVGCRKHIRLARELAEKSVVLLKNDGILPLDRNISGIGVMGPNCEKYCGLYGNYNGWSDNFVTPVEGILKRINTGSSFTYVTDIKYDSCDILHYKPGAVIYIGGFNKALEGEEAPDGEGGDRKDLGLPDRQRSELDALYARGAKVVLVVMGGSPVDLRRDVGKAAAILFVPYPGEQGGEALGRILFGEVSPSGKLPFTFPFSPEDLPPMEDYSMDNRTYRFIRKKPLFPFGYGLAYTRFSCSGLTAEKSSSGSVKLKLTVSNCGNFDSDEVIQVYIKYGNSGYPVPNCSLAGFKRCHIASGSSKELTVTIDKERFMRFDSKGNKYYPAGEKVTLYTGCDSSLQDAISCEVIC